MSRDREIEFLRAEVSYHRNSLALLRARLYRWGLGPDARMRELERQLEGAEQRLRERLRQAS